MKNGKSILKMVKTRNDLKINYCRGKIMTVTCEYCQRIVSTVGSLVRHQKTKVCLKSRSLNNNSSFIEDRFQCKYCDKYICNRENLQKHTQICIERYKKLLDDKDSEIESLKQENIELKYKNDTIELKTRCQIYEKQSDKKQEVIERIAEQPKTNTTNNNTTINNLVLPMIDTSQERIERIVHENYTENHFWDGQKGVAHFTKDNLLYDNENNLGYICTDASRKTFKRKGENGEIIKDLKAIQLTQNISGPIRKKAGEHATNISVKNPNLIESAGKKFFDVDNIHRDNSGFITELACLTSI